MFTFENNIAIYNSVGNQVLENLGVLKAAANESLRYFRHPTAASIEITDHSIELPVTIMMNGVLDSSTYKDTVSELKSLAKKRERLSVLLKSGLYENMYIDAYPTDEDTEHYDTVKFLVSFTQQIIAEEKTELLPARKVANKQDADTVDRGQLNSNPATDTEAEKPSKLFEIFYG